MNTSKLPQFSTKLPSVKKWSKDFRYRSGSAPRATIGSHDIAGLGIKQLNLPNAHKMTAVELYPGLGAWSTALKDVGFKRVISLEPQAGLSVESNGVVEVLKKDGYDWETYQDLKDPKYLGNLENKDWSEVHPEILFTGTIPKGSRGEQLLAQFTQCIITKMAMHSIGRIQMAFWLPDQLYKKFVAPPANHTRCKMSVLAEASSNVSLVCSTEPKDMYPNGEYHLVHVVPFKESLVKCKSEWDVFEYVLKHLFVMQKKSLTHMVK
ncbi:ribosomal RNA adenine methyltransferase KsgA/Erm [Gilbertella persicaria]|uniref:ribosomal RNA adenine methyltransferase KsgA/Erm n=1 Tax=Gilbertella persicaria TaxID=101096 RepID=UPI00222016C1|nr:ribosomal RNA adenine methyltransferase KsgA/Erm [Gilbertella persicaria]KAI8076545.1 ribosomal RNA adenine methyltransferase KsgA/Erm [Gilbertella persicaria]